MTAPGSIFGNRFRLLKQLGKGGMGSVWRAEDERLRKPVAVKLIDPEFVEEPEAVARFKRG